MKTDTVMMILSDISNFNLGMFGISITVFTVLYAFILSRKDSLRELNNIIKSGNNSPALIQKTSFFLAHTTKWKRLNQHLKYLATISIFLFFAATILKYIYYAEENKSLINLVWLLVILTFLVAAYILVVLALVLKNYNKTTNF
ncbi:MAG: hypothetical protein QE277_12180 [Flectobacillus sp.]|nr:hypothetical protein [Flectobacillus sp.]